jgi:hypothetical protein
MVKMQSSTTTIIALLVAGVLLFIAPLATLTDRNDNVAQANIQLIVEEFVTEVKNTGKITRDQYQEFEIKLDSTGNNSYEVEMQIQHIDENVGKKTAQAQYTKIGENVYYSEYTTQILKQIGIKTDDEQPSNEDTMILKEGDIVHVVVKNSNRTAAQTLKSSFLGFSNAGEYAISASSSGMVTVNGVK